MQRTCIGFVARALSAINQVEPSLRHSQEVFPVIIVGRFVRQINTGPGIGTILIFLTHKLSVPDFLLHCDKSGTALAFRRKRKSIARVPRKSELQPRSAVYLWVTTKKGCL